MGHTTSETWKNLMRDKATCKEYAFEINGTRYGSEAEISHSVTGTLYTDFGIGNAACAALNLTIIADNIPKGTVIKRYVRLVSGSTKSEWLPKGVFFSNTRRNNDGEWTVQAYDAMCKADIEYLPAVDEGDWPLAMSAAVDEIAGRMGVELDSRTVIKPDYLLQYPAGYTMREVLCEIAAAHGGNWVMTDEGKLRLIPLLSMPDETSYLVDEIGDTICFGEVNLIV